MTGDLADTQLYYVLNTYPDKTYWGYVGKIIAYRENEVLLRFRIAIKNKYGDLWISKEHIHILKTTEEIYESDS